MGGRIQLTLTGLPLTATFMLPFAIGVCNAIGGNILTDAFGMVAIVAMVPLIVIQVIGLLFTMKKEKQSWKLQESSISCAA